MRSYGQFCPIARGSEILAERWTPIILRNVLSGAYTFNEIAAGAPGLSRALLTRRLRELQRHGVIKIHPKPAGSGSLYKPTPAGQRLWPVLCALGDWAEGYSALTIEDSDPGVVLWSWSTAFLRRDLLPDRRIVIRFESEHRDKQVTGWLVIDKGQAEVCRRNPGFDHDLVVTITDRLAFARWHLGYVSWEAALRSGAIQVTGPRELRRALPTWNAGPHIHTQRRAQRQQRMDSSPYPMNGLQQPKPGPPVARLGSTRAT